MQINDYQAESKRTSVYPDPGKNFIYPAFGVVSEAGEIAHTVKRIVRDKGSVYDDGDRERIKSDIGDVLWYISALATEFNLSLEEIAIYNLDKLRKRMDDGTLISHNEHNG